MLLLLSFLPSFMSDNVSTGAAAAEVDRAIAESVRHPGRVAPSTSFYTSP